MDNRGGSTLGILFRISFICSIYWIVGCASNLPERGGYSRETGHYSQANNPQVNAILPAALPSEEIGLISFYGEKFQGKRTASGEKFDKNGFTAAHRTFPFGTKIKLTHIGNGKSIMVRVTDRGPSDRKRMLDIPFAAAQHLGMIQEGMAKVKMEVLTFAINPKSRLRHFTRHALTFPGKAPPSAHDHGSDDQGNMQ